MYQTSELLALHPSILKTIGDEERTSSSPVTSPPTLKIRTSCYSRAAKSDTRLSAHHLAH